MNKHDLIQKVKALDGISQDERAYLIDLINTKKKYGLVWEDKPEDVEETLRQHLPVLQEVVEKRIISEPRLTTVKDEQDAENTKPQQTLLFDEVGEETNSTNQNNPDNHSSNNGAVNHTLIEGDNLHALTALTFTHENKIDVIYIDPPYNTGNKDFKYNDSFVDREDSYRHSKWLSFMDKRLRIAKRLLSDKGVIFISIDDNEQAQLKMLCDEVFGEVNALGPFIQNKQNAKNDSINVQKNHEYIFTYRKVCLLDEKSKVIPNLINEGFKRKNIFKENDTYFYLNDSITTRGEGGILNARQNLGHTIYYNPQTSDIIAVCDYDIELAKTSNDLNSVYTTNDSLLSKGYLPIRPPKVRGKLGCWTWSLEKVNESKNELIVTGKPNSFTIKKRTFVDKSEVFEESGKLFFDSFEQNNSRSILDYSTNDGTNILNEVLSKSDIFNNPKNLEMLKYLIKLVPTHSTTVLDFFAGSGTTLHATMALNAEDGGSRQCILVTNNEIDAKTEKELEEKGIMKGTEEFEKHGICQAVTYERNKRVIEGYTNAKGVWVSGLSGNNLRYYRGGFVPSIKSETNKRLLTQASTELLCIKENCYNELTAEHELDPRQARIFRDDFDAYMVVVYHSRQQAEVCEALVGIIEGLSSSQKIKLYGFSPEKDTLVEEFYGVQDRIEAIPLPDAIYNAYKATFKIIGLDKKQS
jgi:adenine-specific DNA-methyltransferase